MGKGTYWQITEWKTCFSFTLSLWFYNSFQYKKKEKGSIDSVIKFFPKPQIQIANGKWEWLKKWAFKSDIKMTKISLFQKIIYINCFCVPDWLR
jgi:hypothetical protein